MTIGPVDPRLSRLRHIADDPWLLPTGLYREIHALPDPTTEQTHGQQYHRSRTNGHGAVVPVQLLSPLRHGAVQHAAIGPRPYYRADRVAVSLSTLASGVASLVGARASPDRRLAEY